MKQFKDVLLTAFPGSDVVLHFSFKATFTRGQYTHLTHLKGKDCFDAGHHILRQGV